MGCNICSLKSLGSLKLLPLSEFNWLYFVGFVSSFPSIFVIFYMCLGWMPSISKSWRQQISPWCFPCCLCRPHPYQGCPSLASEGCLGMALPCSNMALDKVDNNPHRATIFGPLMTALMSKGDFASTFNNVCYQRNICLSTDLKLVYCYILWKIQELTLCMP